MRYIPGIAAALTLVLAPSVLTAAGGGGDPPTPTQTTKECKNGQVWDEETKECVDPQGAGLDDDTLYTAARELAYDGQFDHAISILYLAKNRNDPRILNYLGFAHRKAGRVEVGMGYYREALKRDPDYILARSYMGQSLVLQGKIDEAKYQLEEIRARGGRDTWAEFALVKAIYNTGTKTKSDY